MKKIIIISLFVLFAIFVAAQVLELPQERPVCCATPDGLCIDTIQGDIKCERVLSTTQYCSAINSCTLGCCTLLGKDQPLPYTQHECTALCEQAGLNCITQMQWSITSCANPYWT